jgi:hypothetical protein
MIERLQAPHPILSTIEPVVESAQHVRVHDDRIEAVAEWMAYESLSWPDFRFPTIPDGNDADTMDFIFLTASINFAFTDFEKHVIFTTEYDGAERSDSDGMMACLKRAYDRGTPILEGRYLQAVTRADLEALFRGNIEMPMLDERVAIFREIGGALEKSYGGRFHEFMKDGPRGTTAALERLIETFPSFRDESAYRGARVAFQKRAQLLLWQLHARFRASGYFALEDPEQLTVFADYIVPVALRRLGILSYSDALERAINERRLIPRDSEEEIEIRAGTIWASHLLTRAINARRPANRQVIDTVVDTRLWTHYHESHWPHHLTVTTAY